MTKHISAAGKVWRTPVRTPTGGARITLWLNTAEQAALTAYAAEHGRTIPQAAKHFIALGLAVAGRPA